MPNFTELLLEEVRLSEREQRARKLLFDTHRQELSESYHTKICQAIRDLHASAVIGTLEEVLACVPDSPDEPSHYDMPLDCHPGDTCRLVPTSSVDKFWLQTGGIHFPCEPLQLRRLPAQLILDAANKLLRDRELSDVKQIDTNHPLVEDKAGQVKRAVYHVHSCHSFREPAASWWNDQIRLHTECRCCSDVTVAKRVDNWERDEKWLCVEGRHLIPSEMQGETSDLCGVGCLPRLETTATKFPVLANPTG
jgi:hypothetical protein